MKKESETNLNLKKYMVEREHSK